ncbi:hypothetical protein F2Q69_00004203 [Brassica cretica]|uniref:Uncharacterized protein n=1 Tax=Brassica cretica TaxID=69181 RepID=A0A8S9PD17_BRACR|nr:hypothetical protein F2Q69_00004203 [Brassica cretica]
MSTFCIKGLEEEDERGWWDEKVVDDFFKDDMPDWMTEDELTGSDKLQYYEMEEDGEWLHLYAEFVLYSKRLQPGTDLKLLTVHKFKTWITSIFYNIRGNRSSRPLKLRKANVDGGTKKAVDDFFQRMTEDELTGSDKLQYYEMEEDTGWLHLYAKFALYSKRSQLEEIVSLLPVEMRKIIVRTREDVESKKKVKAYNKEDNG